MGSRGRREVTPRGAGTPLDLMKETVEKQGTWYRGLEHRVKSGMEVRGARLLVRHLALWLEWIQEF